MGNSVLHANKPVGQVIMGHIDRGILTQEDMSRLAGETGVTLEFDQFGWGQSHGFHVFKLNYDWQGFHSNTHSSTMFIIQVTLCDVSKSWHYANKGLVNSWSLRMILLSRHE